MTQTYGWTRTQPGYYEDVPYMNHMDAVFARYYTSAYYNWTSGNRSSVPQSWLYAFDAAKNKTVTGAGDLFLGMNAHINLDLAVAAARTSPGPAIWALRGDFLLINDILARVVLAVQESLDAVSPLMSLLDRVGGRTDERILDFSIRRSREEAWEGAVLLAGQNERERAATMERLDVRAAVLARLIARPGGLVRPALELIRSAESDDVPAVIGRLDSAVPEGGDR